MINQIVASLQAIDVTAITYSRDLADDSDDSDDSNQLLLNIVNLVFGVIIAILMFLCFFSLSASMSANLYEQRKEIGVLRSIGLTKIRINLLYFYEALVLVFSACTLGIFVGTLVGYSVKLQMNLIADQDSGFFFPWI